MKKIFIPLLLFAAVLNAEARGLKVSRLTSELKNEATLVGALPRLGWELTSAEKGTQQTAYEIELTDDTGATVWNSGKRSSAQSALVDIGSDVASLKAGHYAWRVRVWDEADGASEWSDSGSFYYYPTTGEVFTKSHWIGAITKADAKLPEGRNYTGGVLKRDDVKAAWAAVDTLSQKSIMLRRSFRTDKAVRRATLNISGLGFYELSLNGKRVGESRFAPLWTDYDKTVNYNTYDVTSLLAKGENVAGVLLGNGFYNVQGGRYRKLQISFGAPTLMFELHIDYADGTSEVVASDESWRYELSPVTFNCIYGGESYDARLERSGWNMAKYDDSAWRPVVLQEGPKGVLRPQRAEPVKIMERYGVKSRTKLTAEQVERACKSTKRTVDASAFVLDMGQNLAGYPEITVKGKRGQKITLLVAESLTDEGAVNQRQTGRQHYYEYTLKGNGTETWHPRFSYYGFRYIQVEGAVMKGDKNPDKLPVISNIESCFVYNSAAKVSEFECSNEIFNAAHRLIEKAVRSNMQSVFTDCPHREKLGWLEQVHLNGPGLFYNYDLTSYIPQQMRNIADSQYANGAVPTVAPQYTVFEGPGMDDFSESPEWGSTVVIAPFMYRDIYGDDSLISEYYDNMRRYVDYLTSRAEDGIVSFGLGDWYDYGDFRAGFSRNTPVPLVATAQYYMDLIYMVEAAETVGNSYDARKYAALAKQVNEAFHKRFYDAERHTYGTGSQCSNALPLFLGMTAEADREAVFSNLLADIKAHDGKLTTGDVGNRYLFQTLAMFGRNDVMYTMHNHEETPGYGFQLKFGATTLTEQWDPRQGSSWNHFMMGQIDEWFFRSLAGIDIRTTHRDGQKIVIRPAVVGDLSYVKATTRTLHGAIATDWTRSGNDFRLNVSIPVGDSAEVYLPDGSAAIAVGSGDYEFQCNIK
jgi:hypothetical protein